jgi:hypothetical protein
VDENCIPSVGLGIPDFGLEYVICCYSYLVIWIYNR